MLFQSPLRHTHTHTHTLACTTHMYKCTHNSCSQMTHTFNTQLIPQTIHAHSISHTDHMHRCTCTHTHTPTTRAYSLSCTHRHSTCLFAWLSLFPMEALPTVHKALPIYSCPGNIPGVILVVFSTNLFWLLTASWPLFISLKSGSWLCVGF